MGESWPVRLFSKSVLKQRKFREITDFLGDTRHLDCLDIGADNGVISYFLRQRGGIWKSADLDATAVQSIRELVKEDVFKVDSQLAPFHKNQFDRVVVVDFLEHIEKDDQCIAELFRIIKPCGELIINVPHAKNSWLRKFRALLGQTDEKHGHLRPGYTISQLSSLLMGRFVIVSAKTYSKFFSECIDTLITACFGFLKSGEAGSQKGVLVTGMDLGRYEKIFRAYSLVYPMVWIFAKLDGLLFWSSGYMLIVKATTIKNTVEAS